MKTKIMGLMCGAILMALLLVSPQAAFSQSLFANCTIQEVTQGTSNALVRLTDTAGSFQNRLFVLQSANKPERNAQLATILTAVSTNKNIRIGFENGNPPVISVVTYINN